jgi:ADP-ribose pyrophosphatase YjhB (NUDIX family)
MPIPCVDLFIQNRDGKILMVKRKNYPEKDQWWSPGGRVLHGEVRENAVTRKLKQECNLEGKIVREIGTFDLLMTDEDGSRLHSISTFYHINVSNDTVILDDQSAEFEWRKPADWLKDVKSPVLIEILKNAVA